MNDYQELIDGDKARNLQEELAQGMYEVENNIRAKETVVEVIVPNHPLPTHVELADDDTLEDKELNRIADSRKGQRRIKVDVDELVHATITGEEGVYGNHMILPVTLTDTMESEAADDVTYALAADNVNNTTVNETTTGNVQMKQLNEHNLTDVETSTNIYTGEPCPVGQECYPDVEVIENVKQNQVAILGAGGLSKSVAQVLVANTGAKAAKQVKQEKTKPVNTLTKAQQKKEDVMRHNAHVHSVADRKQAIAKFTSKGETVIIELLLLTPGQILSNTKTGRFAIFTPNRVITATKICFLPNSWNNMSTIKMNLSDASINFLINQLGETIAFEMRNNRLAAEHVKRHSITLPRETWLAHGFEFNSSGNVDLG